MLPVGFESEIPANKRPHTDALGHTITGIGSVTDTPIYKKITFYKLLDCMKQYREEFSYL